MNEHTALKPRYRLAVEAELMACAPVVLTGNAAHYLSHVLRLQSGDAVALFNRTQGEWLARIAQVSKRDVTLVVETCLRPPAASAMQLTVCFAPIKGGRLETIIEKATELGASVLQPVITQRTIVDKINLERANSIARESAEQCERMDWPEIRPPVKFTKLLTDWPADLPLIYGDETGASVSVLSLNSSLEGGLPPFNPAVNGSPSYALLEGGLPPFAAAQLTPPLCGSPSATQGHASRVGASPPYSRSHRWAILAGPEGGFSPEEFAMLQRVPAAVGVGLGPRILRADTAIITLCVATLMAWGDWQHKPRFVE